MHAKTEENTKLKLNFTETATPGSYTEIRWYKGSTSGKDRIVHFIEHTLLYYYGDYCSGSSPCKESEKSNKGELDTTTGTFIINKVLLDDAGYYYYSFLVDGMTDTGSKYQYSVDVYGRYR